MHDTIINTVFSNTNNICILLGLVIRYSANIIAHFKKKKIDTASDELISRAHAHMLKIYERDTIDENIATQYLVKNALMKEKIKDLKKQIVSKETTINDLKKIVEQLEDLLKHD